MSHSDPNRILKRADPSTIQDKFLVGYQGWFTCAGDGPPIDEGHHGWIHWLNHPIPDGGHPNNDLWPDLSEYSESELYTVPGLELQTGEQAKLFSSRHPQSVRRHFRWMAENAVDGAFLQRFAGLTAAENLRQQRDEIGDRVLEAAEAEGRVFAIMYDVSGVTADRVQDIIETDWLHLMNDKKILESPNYLKEKGRPVIALWGFGFADRDFTPAQIRTITNFIRTNTPGGAYIMAGIPGHWRTSTSDAHTDPEYVQVWLNEFDAISPWTIGRYNNEESADAFAEEKVKGDLELIRQRNQASEMAGTAKRVDYIPVVYPGGSGFNMSQGAWGLNDIKRNGGRFLWRQIWNVKRQGVRIIYGAMWDEYDEGTAFMPVVASKRLLPKSDKFPFLALDADGHGLPSDWYMRICGFAAEGLRGERLIHETFPVKELQDYWSSRPKYDENQTPYGAAGSGSSSSSKPSSDDNATQAGYQEWLATQGNKGNDDEPPPPPYTLEAEEQSAATPAASSSTSPVPASSPGPSPAPPGSISPGLTQYNQANVSPPAQPQPSPSAVGMPQGPSVTGLANDLARTSISSPGPTGPNSSPPVTSPGAAPFAFPQASIPSRSPSLPEPNVSTAGGWVAGGWPPAEWSGSESHSPVPHASSPPPQGHDLQQSPYPGMQPGFHRSSSVGTASVYGTAPGIPSTAGSGALYGPSGPSQPGHGSISSHSTGSAYGHASPPIPGAPTRKEPVVLSYDGQGVLNYGEYPDEKKYGASPNLPHGYGTVSHGGHPPQATQQYPGPSSYQSNYQPVAFDAPAHPQAAFPPQPNYNGPPGSSLYPSPGSSQAYGVTGPNPYPTVYGTSPQGTPSPAPGGSPYGVGQPPMSQGPPHGGASQTGHPMVHHGPPSPALPTRPGSSGTPPPPGAPAQQDASYLRSMKTVNAAMNVAERFGGSSTRRTLEQQVGNFDKRVDNLTKSATKSVNNLTKAGNKYLSKFTK